MIDPITGERETTNVFHFTFAAAKMNAKVPKIIPLTYEEMIMYVEGRRRRDIGLRMAALNRSEGDLRKVFDAMKEE